jgi:hypothetical protein
MLVPAGVIGLYVAAILGPTALVSDDHVLARARSAYREAMEAPAQSLASHQLFARAAGWLEILRRRGVNNRRLAVNLAQAYLLADDVPNAILASRRGLRLAPADPALRRLLDEARNQVDYPTYGAFAKPPVDDWPPWLPRLSSGTRLVLAFLSYGLACLLFTRWRMVRGGTWLSLVVIALGAALFLGGGLIAEQERASWGKAHPLVVVSTDDKVVLHKGNGVRYPCYNATAKIWEEADDGIPPGATPLKPGVEAHVRFDKGDWLQIELTSGEVGWVRRSEVLMEDRQSP